MLFSRPFSLSLSFLSLSLLLSTRGSLSPFSSSFVPFPSCSARTRARSVVGHRTTHRVMKGGWRLEVGRGEAETGGEWGELVLIAGVTTNGSPHLFRGPITLVVQSGRSSDVVSCPLPELEESCILGVYASVRSSRTDLSSPRIGIPSKHALPLVSLIPLFSRARFYFYALHARLEPAKLLSPLLRPSRERMSDGRATARLYRTTDAALRIGMTLYLAAKNARTRTSVK